MVIHSEVTDETKTPSKKMMLVSDIHLERTDESLGEILDNIVFYKDEYDCDDLIIGGDISHDYKINSFLATPFDEFKIVRGNHDYWNFDFDKEYPIEYGDFIEWTEKNNNAYDIFLTHRPQDMKISCKSKNSSDCIKPFDIVIHGHSHLPYDRILDNGSLAIGLGSTYANYWFLKKSSDSLPSRSFHSLKLKDDEIIVEHIDYDNNILFESNTYTKENGNIVPKDFNNLYDVEEKLYDHFRQKG